MKRSAEYMKGRSESDYPKRAYKGAQSDNEFVQLEVPKSRKAELKEYCVEPVELDAALIDLFNDGTKVTVKFDDRNNCVVAFAFAAEDSDNAGYILTGRASSATRALRELVFKHHVLLNGEWSQYHALGDAGDDPDW